MLQTLINVFHIKELRQKLLFTLGMLVVFRLGHWVPLPGINQLKLAEDFKKLGDQSAIAKIAQYVSTFSGGALSHSTIFGLGIMPYITAGIIFQLVSTAYPPLKKIQDEGPSGRQKIQEWTRYATVILCLFQASAWLLTIDHMGYIYPQAVGNGLWWVTAVLSLTAGTVFLMWLGEQIDKHGIGNGVSMIIMAGILASMPTAVIEIINNFEPGASTEGKMGTVGVLAILVGFIAVVAGSVVMTVAQRRIPVQQAKHTRGRKVFGGQRSFLPLRINHGGVMPVVFASTLMILPITVVTGLYQTSSGRTGWWFETTRWLTLNLGTGEFLYVVLYIAMVYVFSYFWITVQFNPEEMSKQLKEHGSFIPGLRPGPRTAEYLETVMTRITFVGAAFLAVIAVAPVIVNKSLGVSDSITHFLGGTGLLIVVSVTLDFLQRVEANLLMRNYQGFLSGGDDTKGPRVRGIKS